MQSLMSMQLIIPPQKYTSPIFWSEVCLVLCLCEIEVKKEMFGWWRAQYYIHIHTHTQILDGSNMNFVLFSDLLFLVHCESIQMEMNTAISFWLVFNSSSEIQQYSVASITHNSHCSRSFKLASSGCIRIGIHLILSSAETESN